MALILVTGASAGLGLASATTLADQGHDVVLHARSAGRMRGHPVLARMHGVVYGDLSSLDATIQVAEGANEIGAFDAVIHNAGVLRGPEVLAVNAIAPFVLTALMAPRRSIYLGSSMHFSGSTDLGAREAFDVPGRSHPYEDSKLYVTTLAMAVAARQPDMLSHAVDPGWVPTRMGGLELPTASPRATSRRRGLPPLTRPRSTLARVGTGTAAEREARTRRQEIRTFRASLWESSRGRRVSYYRGEHLQHCQFRRCAAKCQTYSASDWLVPASSTIKEPACLNSAARTS